MYNGYAIQNNINFGTPIKKEDIIFAVCEYTDSYNDKYQLFFFVRQKDFIDNGNTLEGLSADETIKEYLHDEFSFYILDYDYCVYEIDGAYNSVDYAINELKSYGFRYNQDLQNYCDSIKDKVGKENYC